MLQQVSVESSRMTAFVENYLDCIESLPNDLQRHVTQMREIDYGYQAILNEIKQVYQKMTAGNVDNNQLKRYIYQLKRALIRSQELGDEKLQVASTLVDLVENRARQIQVDREHLECLEKPPVLPEQNKPKKDHKNHHTVDKPLKRSQRQKAAMEAKKDDDKPAKKKKKSKQRGDIGPSPQFDMPVDPDEPRYCLCNQVSYGEMVGCDNKDCPFEWFHFGCVGLHSKPKGKWYCPKCVPEFKKK
ncbi:inhibitor of growth protein 1-like [Antedon mediterranea]|uniref:inhibitor of growth protein 1-like n=1 Tax=Antedon mediterranea TaxID=105859 RepID=UPI003AF90ED1